MKKVVLHALQVCLSFLYIFVAFFSHPWCELTCFAVVLTAWARLEKICSYFFPFLNRPYRFNCRMVTTYFASQTTWNNRGMIALQKSKVTFWADVYMTSPIFKPKLAWFEREKGHKLFFREIFRSQSVISHTKRAKKKIQIVVSHALEALSVRKLLTSMISTTSATPQIKNVIVIPCLPSPLPPLLSNNV